jgi:hypothetical protein
MARNTEEERIIVVGELVVLDEISASNAIAHEEI